MGFFSKDIKTLDDLFVHTLRDIYYAEKQIEKALPKMIEKATDPQLKAGFEKHLGQTKGHIERVEQVFELQGVKAKQINCPAIDGILEEADDVSGDVDDKDVLDAALIASAQAVEHYEMTRYGTLIAWAKQLGRSDCANVLAKNLKEEQATDRKLTEMAESKIIVAVHAEIGARGCSAVAELCTSRFRRLRIHAKSARSHISLSGVSGRSRMRFPVSLKTAFATSAQVPVADCANGVSCHRRVRIRHVDQIISIGGTLRCTC